MVGVEHSENIVCKGRRVTVWEELSVDILEFCFAEESARTIFDKAYYSGVSVCR